MLPPVSPATAGLPPRTDPQGKPLEMQRVLLVRHAQCLMNLHVDERIGGRTNHSPLTELGEAQAAALGAHLRAALAHAGVPPQRVRVYSSTAVRAVDTAKHVMAALEVGAGASDVWVLCGCCA